MSPPAGGGGGGGGGAVGVEGVLTIKKGRGVLPRVRDPYPFPDTFETTFQTKVRRTYNPL